MRGAGQGPLVLVAEVIAAAIAEALTLPVPELVIVDIPERFGINEPDPEIRDLLLSSTGANVGLAFLAEATTFDLSAGDELDASFASRTVWMDSFLMNVDRTARNPNLLLQHGRPFLIDHGASLYPQYSPDTFLSKAESPFAPIRDHLLLSAAQGFAEHAQLARERVTAAAIADAVSRVTDDLWPRAGEAGAEPLEQLRARHTAFLLRRLEHATIFEQEVLCAQRAAEASL